ncbi:hypothetical protein QYF36_015563 [Acer negundo]|nr:hypothetical protein QYF36_015563 [Acer negundo]
MPHKDKDSESFALENSSTSEGIEILSEGSQEESEDISSDETVKETKEEAIEEKEEELNVSEPNSFTAHRPKEESVAKGKSKSKFFIIPKFIALFLVLFFACLSLSVSDSHVVDLSLSTNFYVLHKERNVNSESLEKEGHEEIKDDENIEESKYDDKNIEEEDNSLEFE